MRERMEFRIDFCVAKVWCTTVRTTGKTTGHGQTIQFQGLPLRIPETSHTRPDRAQRIRNNVIDASLNMPNQFFDEFEESILGER